MGSRLTRHIRRPHPFPVLDKWRIDCDCGWRGEIPRYAGSRDLPRDEAERELNKLFVAHVPAGQRQLYVLVDQRRSGLEDENDLELPTGNMIMPEGKPCTLLGWIERAGVYRGRVKGFDHNDPELELPIGEIRTADGRVFRIG